MNRKFARSVKVRQPVKRSSFEVEDRIKLVLDVNLAAAVGNFILQSGTGNTALTAYAHKLLSMTGDDDYEGYEE